MTYLAIDHIVCAQIFPSDTPSASGDSFMVRVNDAFIVESYAFVALVRLGVALIFDGCDGLMAGLSVGMHDGVG